MGKINVLSFEIANLIAAGEVVERPASVLKELIENSIDAGATEIVAEIKKGGVALIRVTDNGCGIEKEDLPVALKRHATSKISEKDDLYSIMTLGFRGEALAAISSVSEVTIITKTKNSEIGYMLTSEGGNVVDITEVGASEGTTVVVENLFFNVPARRKFLKKDSTEAMNVAALVERVALSRPDISIQLLIDGVEKFKTYGDGDLKNCIRAIYGRAFADKMIKVEGESEGIHVSGYVGRSDNVRKNRNLENVFINNRYVKSLTAQAAIEKAFTSYIAPECFPTCALFITMNPGIVDVNVHPAKLEVKFSDERIVFEAIYYTVRTALENEQYRPEMTLGTNRKSDYNPRGAFVPIGYTGAGEQIRISEPTETTDFKETASLNNNHNPENFGGEAGSHYTASYDKHASRNTGDLGTVTFSSPSFNSGRASASSGGLTPKESLEILKKYESSASDNDAQCDTNALPDIQYKYIGEVFDTYVIIEYKSEMMIIDKHAAHERVIFEDLKKRQGEDNRIGSQALMLPITIVMSSDELCLVREYADEFRSIGYDFNINDKTCDLLAIPDAISAQDAEGLFVKMAGELLIGQGNPEITEAIRREKALYQIACKAAIKGGRFYDSTIIDWLIKKLLLLPDITVCPHGRPVAYVLKKSELDRQFDRLK